MYTGLCGPADRQNRRRCRMMAINMQKIAYILPLHLYKDKQKRGFTS
ncbi:hypothetical protein CLOSYM_00693 [[Clostridium] symbiosum ATCC 14940]|uniref:Uncharacterized protein n=1 Tax=[Clostridium] symbiosum ATCC 14940 TaxID=411472 RepID=A0ABC9U2C4_CLOSY|nr:hypothetical protein CLOSYM_00693 [[Clostridium] symbiosum ATCC 14940]